MIIKTMSEEKAVDLLREWSGKNPSARMTEAERMFRTACDRYVLVEVENQQELNRLYTLEEYLTGGRGFYLYLRCPNDVVSAIRAGKTALPHFFHRAEGRYSSAYGRGTVKILLGLLQEQLDRRYDMGLFIDILARQRQEAQASEGTAQTGGTAQPGGMSQGQRANVTNFSFGRQGY